MTISPFSEERFLMTQSPNTQFYPASTIEVDTHQNGQRLDNFLMAQFRELPKARIYQMIRKGEVRINKGRAKPTSRLQTGDVVDRKSTRLNSSHVSISYAVFCLKKK